MTFRLKLLLLVGLLTIAAIGNAALALWAAQGFHRQVEGMALAEEQLALHIKLEADTNDLFRRYAASLLAPAVAPGDTPAELEDVVAADIDRIRRLVARELPFRGEEELEELQRLDAIARGLGSVEREYLRLRDEAETDQGSARFAALLRFMTRRIENDVAPLIDAAVEDEQGEVDEARQAVAALAYRVRAFAIASAAFALIAATIGSSLLLRSVLRPFDALVEGTERLARGELSYRIPVLSGGELARLSRGFNAMAARLEDSNRRLRAEEEELTRKVAGRTAELERANARLAETDATRRRFLADVSHELRTPLTVIRGEAEVALRTNERELDEGVRSTLTGVVEQADHMARLVDDLLFVARREAGEAKLALRPVPLAPLLRKAVGDAHAIGERSAVIIELENDAPGVTLAADAGRLKQLLMVLLDNALRYSPGGGTILVRALRTPDSVAISVHDEGIGIPAEDLPHVFERFVRGANAAIEGTGLGLPVAKAIAEAHGGRLSVDSREGEGTVATVALPLERDGGGSAIRGVA